MSTTVRNVREIDAADRRALERVIGKPPKEAAGWAMLARHPVNGKLYNVVSDEHAMGLLWMAVPLVVIDVYEHAFHIDYQNRKAEYVDKFLKHIDWNEANVRFRAT